MKHLKLLTSASLSLLYMGLLTGCQSARPTARALEDKSSGLEIRVTILPIENQEGWFELKAVVDERKLVVAEGGKTICDGHDHLAFPALRAAVDVEPAVVYFPGGGSNSGPRATFKVSHEGGMIIGEYEAGFADGKRSVFSHGRTVLGSYRAQPDGAANVSQPIRPNTNSTPAAAGSRR